MAIQYVGGQTAGRTNASSATSVNFALSGGLASTPSAGDLVIVTVVVGSQARNPTLAVTTPAGYATIGSQLNVTPTTYDTSLQVSYKFMTATPDTAVTIPGSGNNADGEAYSIQVFRGVDQNTPLDVTPQSATGSGANNRFDAPAITPATAGAWVVICGGGAAAAGGTYTGPANFTTNFLSVSGTDTNDGTVGSGYWDGWSSGEVNPAAYTGGSATANDSWAGWSIVLRPAGITATLTSTDAADTVSAAGANAIAAALAASDGADTISAAAANAIAAALSQTESDDTISSAGTVAAAGITADLDHGEEDDAVASAAAAAIAAALDQATSDDTISGAATAAIAGAASISEDDDAISSAATAAIAGDSAIVEDDDTIASSAASAIAAAAAIAEDDDTIASAATISDGAGIAASLDQAEDDDAISSAATAAIAGDAAIADDGDTIASAGTAAIVAGLSSSEGDDAIAAAGAMSLGAALDVEESGDAISSEVNSGQPRDAALDVTEDGDAIAASATGPAVETVITVGFPTFGKRRRSAQNLSVAPERARIAAIAMVAEANDGCSSSATVTGLTIEQRRRRRAATLLLAA